MNKNKKGLKLREEGTLLGKIGTLMDEKGTKNVCKECLKRNKTATRPKTKLISLLLAFVRFAK